VPSIWTKFHAERLAGIPRIRNISASVKRRYIHGFEGDSCFVVNYLYTLVDMLLKFDHVLTIRDAERRKGFLPTASDENATAEANT
jgi:hypothetical protein